MLTAASNSVMLKRLFVLLLCISFLSAAAPAMETDQYNLPPTPLVDIGDELTQFVWDGLIEAAAKLNSEIDAHEACLTSPETQGCGSARAEDKKLVELRSGEALAKAIYHQLGEGTVFTSHAGEWLTSHEFLHTPASYKAAYNESIYFVRPVNYATLSPTIRVNGVEMGTDKFDHFFQQGYSYYKIYKHQLAHGKTPDAAATRSIAWGRRTEKTIYGYLVSGVFSNADLFANYAGMKFYLNLSAPVTIAGKEVPATFSVVEGKWQIGGEEPRTEILSPFVADQMNEALNPSSLLPLLYPIVRTAVKKNACPKWTASFPMLTKQEMAKRTASLETWAGEDYGFSHTNHMVTLADTCFDE